MFTHIYLENFCCFSTLDVQTAYNIYMLTTGWETNVLGGIWMARTRSQLVKMLLHQLCTCRSFVSYCGSLLGSQEEHMSKLHSSAMLSSNMSLQL